MRTSTKFSPEVAARAVSMTFDAKDQHPSQGAAIESIAGCTGERLRRCVRQGGRSSGVREETTMAEQPCVKELERGVRRADEILKLASAFFAQVHLDRPGLQR